MNFNMTLRGFEEAKVLKMEQLDERMVLHVSMPLREQVFPICQQNWSEGGATPPGTARAEDPLRGVCRLRQLGVSWSRARGKRRHRNGNGRHFARKVH